MKDVQKGLPEGWTTKVKTHKSGTNVGVNYKCYIAPSGCKFYNMEDVARYLGTEVTENCTSDIGEMTTNCTPQPKKSDSGPSKTDALVGRREATGLPAGWIYESITRKSGRKDPYYIDPETGYAFRSKPDALRYLETGDILKCAIKPKKRDIITNEAIREAASPPTTTTIMKQKAGQSSPSDDLVAAGVPLSRGPSDKKEKLKDIKSSNSNVAAKRGRGRKFSLATVDALTDEGAKTKDSPSSKPENAADNDDDDLLFSLDRVILLSDCPSDLAEEECAMPSSFTPPEGKASKKGRPRKKVHRKKKLVSTPPATIVPSANQHVENGVEELGNSKTQSKRKRKEKKELDTPRRSSKRLAALGAQNSEATHSVMALQHSPVKATQIIQVSEKHSQPQYVSEQLNNQPTESAISLCGQAGLKDLATTEEVHKEPESSVTVPLGENLSVQDYFQDPCLEFAFKTLTGAIPVAEDLVGEDYFQQQAEPTQTLDTNETGLEDLKDIGVDDFETDGLQFDLTGKPALETQMEKPTQGNGSLHCAGDHVEEDHPGEGSTIECKSVSENGGRHPGEESVVECTTKMVPREESITECTAKLNPGEQSMVDCTTKVNPDGDSMAESTA